jgi:hypothetical protein
VTDILAARATHFRRARRTPEMRPT